MQWPTSTHCKLVPAVAQANEAPQPHQHDWRRHRARQLASIVRTEQEHHKLLTLLAQRYADRAGGYTRVVRTRHRLGDAAPMALVEFVDRPGELRDARPGRARAGLGVVPAAAAPLLAHEGA